MTDAERAGAWSGVAKNLAQVLELRDGDGILKLSEQMKAHGLIAVEPPLPDPEHPQ